MTLTQREASVAMLSFSSFVSTALTPLKVSWTTSVGFEADVLIGAWEGSDPGASSKRAATPENHPVLDHCMAPLESKARAELIDLRGGRRCRSWRLSA